MPPDASLPVLSINGVDARYGKRLVIRDISLEVFAGEVFGLVGLNGAGKTTLIKTILGLKEPDAGTVSINNIRSVSAQARRSLSCLPERFDPPWFLNGFEFIRFTLSLYGKSMPDETVAKEAERLALDPEALKTRSHTLSKGMRQKLGLLAAVLADCPLLVLDEPMSGLDPLARCHVRNRIAAEGAAGKAVFLSSHLLTEMVKICNRMAALHNGSLIFCGSPEEFMQTGGSTDPETAFLNMARQTETEAG